MDATLRFLEGAARLPGVRLSLVSQDPLERVPAPLRARLAGHWQVADAFDADALVTAAGALAARLGTVERLVGPLEQLQEALALARERLGLPGLAPAAARNFRDKARMKDCLRAAGVPCARHRLAASASEVRDFARATGLPIVVKPPAGAGASGTHRLDDDATLERYLATQPPHAAAPVLCEEFLSGAEHSFDAVLLGGALAFWSVSRYLPAPLTVLENPWIQWCVLLPRELDGYEDARRVGARALAALGLDTGMAHVEWFRRPDGGIAVSEAAARPPGAQFTTLLSYAHDADFYAAWPRLMVEDRFEVPARRWAVGAAYVRGQGAGRVRRIHGLDVAQRELGALVVESRLPAPGAVQGPGYEGVGHVVVRHTDTAVVEAALARLVSLIRVELA
ncbi:MAG: ATP-grasp domain-containing protein [Proteobacteria bacterium]|nr:ATP-grasp domain-containing protein [Pseudomonadota bacterium]